MPKLRNAGTDIAMFTQWLARKCRNHNPLSELALQTDERKKLGAQYKQRINGDVKIIGHGERDTLIYMAAGRAFSITVRELGPEEVESIDQLELEEVGY